MKHFFIILVVVKWNDWNTIIYLKSEAVHWVIDNNYVLQLIPRPDISSMTILIDVFAFKEYPQIFDVISFFCQVAVLSVQPVLD